MEDSVAFFTIGWTAIFGGLLVGNSWVFRKIIEGNAFNGIQPNEAKQFIKAQPFRKRLFMTYIRKCNTTGKQRIGLAMWFLVCHYIHAIASIGTILMGWYDAFLKVFFNQDMDASIYVIGHFTYSDMLDLLAFIVLCMLILSVVIAFPFTFLSKNKFDS